MGVCGGHYCYASRFRSSYTKVLVTLVHGTGREDLSELWIKELKRESDEIEKVLPMVELENLSKTEHPVTWIQRKSHRFGQGAHVD